MKILALLSFLLLALAPGENPSAPRVLIISPERDGLAAEFHALLSDHDIPAVIAQWREATPERAREFDLVLVTGSGRTVNEEQAVLDLDRPVLGVGQYGCAYFGLLRLKHGAQHT